MFSQRRSFLKGKLFYIVLVGLFAFGLWVNQSPDKLAFTKDKDADSKYSTTTEGNLEQVYEEPYDIMDNIVSQGASGMLGGEENTSTVAVQNEPTDSAYFLVKEVNGVIKIFFYDEQGKESLIRETDIAFSLLSVGDQELFQKGIIEQTSDELDELLQDFES